MKKERRFIARLDRLYPDILNKDHSKASYKPVRGFYEDKKRRICFPYFFEILAVPVAEPKYAKRGITYFGAVNYSVPSRGEGVVFEGDYYEQFPDEYIPPGNIKQLLGVYKFNDDAEDSSKVPSVIIANRRLLSRGIHMVKINLELTARPFMTPL